MTAPCSSWATYADLPEAPLGMYPETQWCQFLSMATEILWNATQHRWRGANLAETVALRAAPPRAGEGGWPYHRSWGTCDCYLGAGYGSVGWYPQWRRDWGRHIEPAAVRLPRSDVTGITLVLLDGGAFTDWALDGSWLARTDGRGWPSCGDRTSVTYTFGRIPPFAGVEACAILAVELARYVSPDPDQPGQLPRRSRSESLRAGTGSNVNDYTKILTGGLTGIYVVDAWIRSVNPKGRIQIATAWSPDLPLARRRANTG